jgi:hypothetical protein
MPLLLLRDAIIAAWEAAEPPAYDSRPYRHVEILAHGSSAHRTFAFEWKGQSGTKEQGSSRHGVDQILEARMSLHIPPRSTKLLDVPYREAQVLTPLIPRIRIARVMVPFVESAIPEPSKDVEGNFGLDLVITISCRTKETS